MSVIDGEVDGANVGCVHGAQSCIYIYVLPSLTLYEYNRDSRYRWVELDDNFHVRTG